MPSSNGSSDFVRKLFNMLEEPEYRHILRWSDSGDSFIVLDTNEFTKTILPRHFKHSNFASFVRQLNKYDFHKVRHEEGAPSIYGEGAWEFRHDDFQLHHKDLLDNIKRKAPSKRNLANENTAPVIENLKQQVDSILDFQKLLDRNLSGLATSYQTILLKMFELKRGIESRDLLMSSIISYLCDLEGSTQRQANPGAMFVPSHPLQELLNAYQALAKGQVATTSPQQIPNQIQQASAATTASSKMTVDTNLGTAQPSLYNTPSSDYELANQEKPADSMASAASLNTPLSSNDHSLNPHAHGSYPMYEKFQPIQHPNPGSFTTHLDSNASMAKSFSQISNDSLAKASSVATSMSQMGAAVPTTGLWKRQPRILLVEDDELSRRMTIKFLTSFDCQVDVAVDGIGAVNKANAGGFDLILMDFILPNLDGLSVTCLIRQYDHNTPILAITSNISMNDAVTYFNHGVTDLLVKPFTKLTLLQLLKKQLLNLLQADNSINMSDVPSTKEAKDDKAPVTFYLENDAPMYPQQMLQDPIQADLQHPH
ncbi:stress-responsive DNA-binding transcription factor Prr1 [Schizosaccharomyces pombe]|uniref:Transcription factor prr1 n=1 Tax=Schizosaccharomyces pombe (strain 972 / ATCC 24843) TaxID=284812 RepID=PRR1_SCHPO|nr:transcription factor Prr1 [Schizosaccharomyces pombe]O14283.2 RecName: Full=Transcription factor prr1; AltName: Full=Pombe response regulator 1 [Schizosaccharomyces pombe 972h-]BAB16722.1 Prr1 [Schizosaccharomyces pombe]CAB16301.1 transcription factor Prr1 [Schizosaccharomyces pombe]|eukprot:NP_594284.1 transcription factor Prr1 [Schizosaccharomyces pombe]